jgi:hypothetical protein
LARRRSPWRPKEAENASPARTDGERIAEGANIRRQSRSYFANALMTTRSTLPYRSWIGFPALARSAGTRDSCTISALACSREFFGPRTTRMIRSEASAAGGSKTSSTDRRPYFFLNFASFRVFGGDPMLFFDVFGCPPSGRTFPVDSVRQNGNSIVTFPRKTYAIGQNRRVLRRFFARESR